MCTHGIALFTSIVRVQLMTEFWMSHCLCLNIVLLHLLEAVVIT